LVPMVIRTQQTNSITNNASNYGTQAGRDINIGTMHVNSEKRLSTRGIYRQILAMLKNAGYLVSVGEMFGDVKDISFTYNEDSSVLIQIGSID